MTALDMAACGGDHHVLGALAVAVATLVVIFAPAAYLEWRDRTR